MKVVIIDDDKLVSMSLKMILENGTDIEVAVVGEDGREAVSLYKKYSPDILLLDIRMQYMTGLEAARNVLAQEQFAQDGGEGTVASWRNTATIRNVHPNTTGYVLKQDYEGLVPAIRAAASGQIVFGGKIVDKLPGLLGGTAAYDYAAQGITQKEYEMIQLVAQGLSNKEIAEKTFLSEGTIRNYISTVLEKLNLRDRTQLSVFYYQNGGR